MKKQTKHAAQNSGQGEVAEGIEKSWQSAGSGLASFINTVFSEWWDTQGFDFSLRSALEKLSMVRVTAFLVKISGRSALSFSVPILKEQEVLTELETKVTAIVDNALKQETWEDGYKHHLKGDYHFAVAGIPVRGVPEATSLSVRNELERHCLKGLEADDLNYCAYTYKIKQTHLKDQADESFEEYHARHYSRPICLMLFDIFRNREHRLAAFPKEISERYWQDSACMRHQQSDSLAPPWEGNGKTGCRTATLSIDLRRSTFCMEQADEGWMFGEWLDELVKILTAVTHNNGGVFDKFTGDGALVHFLERECSVVYSKPAVSAAVMCAIEMQVAVEFHLKRLRKFLRFDSGKLGAGVAIDVSEAFWSIDGSDSPIVVGRGVVGACRLGGGAQAKTIRLSNIAWQGLDQELKSRIKGAVEVAIKTKEWPEEMEVLAWEFKALISPESDIPKICEHIYKKTDLRSAMLPK